jgi:hypothetical protein
MPIDKTPEKSMHTLESQQVCSQGLELKQYKQQSTGSEDFIHSQQPEPAKYLGSPIPGCAPGTSS